MIRLLKSSLARCADLPISRLFTSLVVAASATSVLPSSAHAQTVQTRTDDQPKSINEKDAPINASAEQMTGRPDRQINLDRDVEIIRGKTVIRSDKAEYRIIQDEVDATGHLWMKRLGDRYTGDNGTLNMESGKGFVNNPTYLFGSNGGRGKAERIDFLSDEEAVVTNGTYSTCEAANPDWYLDASTLDIDSGRDVGTVHTGIVYFKGLPIMAAPVMSFPLSSERKSGVLPPTFGGSSTGGAELTVPYYFNIAPNRDLTLSPRFIARRGLQLGADARYLGDTYSGGTTIEGIQDKLTGTTRYGFASKHTQTLSPNLSFGWNVGKASDNEYLTDFSRVLTASTQRLLNREAYASYSYDSWVASVRATKYQLLQDVNSPIQKPYDRVPQLTLSTTRQDIGGFDLNFASELTRFTNVYTAGALNGKDMMGADRAYVTNSISFPIISSGYFITPKATVEATTYRMNNVPAGTPTSFNRVVPTLSLDAGMTFERDTTLFGQDVTQTLEPRLFYVRTPYRDQSLLPNFDSGLADFNFAQIFSENRFVGHDRISDANQITAALVSRYIEENGLERLRLAFGQRFYLSDSKVANDYSGITKSGSKSDILLSVGGQITSKLSLDNTVQYSETLHQMVRANFGGRWQPAPKKVLNLTYRVNNTANPLLKQVDFSAQWPVSQRWYAVSRLNYSIPDKTLAEGLLGLEYQADCWVFRIVGQRIPTSSTKTSTSFFIQLELNGFSKIGSNPLEALSSSIPGYQIINKPDNPTRY